MFALIATIFVLPAALFEVATRTADGAVLTAFGSGMVLLVSGISLVIAGLLRRSHDLRRPRDYASITYDTPAHSTRRANAQPGDTARSGAGAFNAPLLSGGHCAGDGGS
ncbi:hypothetical protein IWX64_001808 [Arthrobacter sp. CAN_A212]|uniref:hypothetical protein n=1 Tax=Arthrobacter sp. CAN_A212 TaxID=2787719 RepID=UPI0018C93138